MLLQIRGALESPKSRDTYMGVACLGESDLGGQLPQRTGAQSGIEPWAGHTAVEVYSSPNT